VNLVANTLASVTASSPHAPPPDPTASSNGCGWRRFSPREAARLQGFPEEWVLHGARVAPWILPCIAARLQGCKATRPGGSVNVGCFTMPPPPPPPPPLFNQPPQATSGLPEE
jgi:site-specific DNA-cytosine methylase